MYWSTFAPATTITRRMLFFCSNNNNNNTEITKSAYARQNDWKTYEAKENREAQLQEK